MPNVSVADAGVVAVAGDVVAVLGDVIAVGALVPLALTVVGVWSLPDTASAVEPDSVATGDWLPSLPPPHAASIAAMTIDINNHVTIDMIRRDSIIFTITVYPPVYHTIRPTAGAVDPATTSEEYTEALHLDSVTLADRRAARCPD